jgi:hypothetical protein
MVMINNFKDIKDFFKGDKIITQYIDEVDSMQISEEEKRYSLIQVLISETKKIKEFREFLLKKL